MSEDLTTIYLASKFITMEDSNPEASAVAVRNGRIVAIGSRESVQAQLADRETVLDETFVNRTVVPGFIDQHLHPILGASTLATEVISTEDWNLPDRTFPAANSQDEYRQRLVAAEAELASPDEWLFSWGYHSLWHGPLNRQVLDQVSSTRPIGIWQRSCHEFYLNSPAIELLGLEDALNTKCAAEQAEATQTSTSGLAEQTLNINLDEGHFWENGFFTFLLPKISSSFLTLDRLVFGLEQLVTYLHQNGVTAFNEPGVSLMPGLWDLYQAILGRDETPFFSYFLVDARSQYERGVALDDALEDSASQIALAPEGKVSFFADQVKLFADGAIISQLMQMRDPYLDHAGHPDPSHHGEWLMTPDVLEERGKLYWDAGYQLHIHVNGDLGLDIVLDMLERRLRENYRDDHRSVIVHFANSTEEQVDRIAELGAIVSANPYYTVGFADKYSGFGLGPERADHMVRSQSVIDCGIPLSFHSDLPMGPSDPLKLMWCAVNRLTQSGRTAAPDQRISVHDALRAVTIGAAYSWRREDELGSLAVGKVANLTVLDSDPYDVDPTKLNDIVVEGTLFEGRWFPVERKRSGTVAVDNQVEPLAGHDSTTTGTPCVDKGCACQVSRLIVDTAEKSWRAA